MAIARLQWYETFVYFIGVVVAVVDPITDMWTCVVFYRGGHITWFVVGITFVVLPSLVYPLVNYYSNRYFTTTLTYAQILKLFAFNLNPFAPAISRLLVFVVCCKNFKQMWKEGGIDTVKGFPRRGDRQEKLGNVVTFGMAEATVEAAPQFLIQLYAMTAQQEDIEVIQMVSLPVSFLSLVWTVTKYEYFVYKNDNELPELGLLDQVAIFLCHLLLLASRMLSVAFFTVVYKWWILVVIICHCSPTFLFSLVGGHCGESVSFQTVLLFSAISWLSWFDFSFQDFTRKARWILQWLPYLMLFIENICMILAFYTKSESTSWYTLPVTIVVCILSPCGSLAKLLYSRVVLKKKTQTAKNVGRTRVSQKRVRGEREWRRKRAHVFQRLPADHSSRIRV